MSRSQEFESGHGKPEDRPLWHVTSRKTFKPSDKVRPVSGGGYRQAREPVLHATTDPNYWVNIAGGWSGTAYAERRKWAAELDYSDHPPVPREGLDWETRLDPSKVRVKRLIPVEEALKETTGYDPVARKTLPQGYRYPGPDFPEKKPRKPKTP